MLENGAKGKRRLRAEEKFPIFIENCRADVSTVQVLRRHGLCFSDLKRIREKVERGALKELSSRTRGSNGSAALSRQAHESLKAEKYRLEKALIELSIENTLLKKSSAKPDRAHPVGEIIASDQVVPGRGDPGGCGRRN